MDEMGQGLYVAEAGKNLDLEFYRERLKEVFSIWLSLALVRD